MKDDLGYLLAGVEELKERIAELEAQYKEAERLRLYNLDKVLELYKDNADWQKACRNLEALVRDLARFLIEEVNCDGDNCICKAREEILSRVPKELQP